MIQSPIPGETVNANPVLDWNAVPGASKYRVQVSSSSSFSTGPNIFTYNPQDTANTKATIPTDLPLGTIYWRVAATDGTSSGVGPFADSSFERVWSIAPEPTGPADGATLTYPEDTVSFSWEPLAGAKTYKVQVDDGTDFIEPLEYTTNNASFTLRNPQTVGQAFHWRVQGVAATTGLHSAWSQPRSYTIAWPDVPALVEPANTTAVPITDVVLDWEPVPGAASYQVQVSPNGDWSNNVAIDVVVKGTRYSPLTADVRLGEPTTLNNGAYYWRVRARDGMTPQPNLGGWSEERQFLRGWTDRPNLLTPADETSTTGTPTFSWEPIPHASHYLLEVSRDINFSPGTTMQCVTAHTTYTPYVLEDPMATTAREPGPCLPPAPNQLPITINIGQRYYWHVRGLDGPLSLTGTPPPVLGLWSDTGNSDTFTFVHDVAPPIPTGPDNGAQVHTPVLQWEPVSGQGRYRVRIWKNGFKEVDILTYATSYTPTKALTPGVYTWSVLSENKTSGTGLDYPSLHRSFELVAPNPTFAAPAPLTPAEDAPGTTRMPSMTWTPVTGATKYQVMYSNNTGSFAPLSSVDLPFAGFTYWGGINEKPSLPAGTYQWYVKAFVPGAPDEGVVNGPIGEFTITPLELTQYISPCSAGVACLVGDTPTLKWHPVPGAGSYIVYLAADANFTNIQRRYRTVFTELTPRESLRDSQAGQSYYWFVRPCIDPDNGSANGSPCGPFGSDVQPTAFRFRKHSAPVTLDTPANGAVVANEPTFRWNDYLGLPPRAPGVTQEARQYRIEVSTANTFATLIDTQTVDQMTYTPTTKTYPEGPLYWRVQALDGSANPLTFSAARQLTKSSPPVVPTAPASGTTIGRVPTFRWDPLLFAAKYEVEVYNNADTLYSPTNRIVYALGADAPKVTGWTPTTSLPAGEYAWRVRRLDVDGKPGVWSGGGTFDIAVAAPTLVSPADGAAVLSDDLDFSWTPSNAAVQYRFQSSTSASFSTPFETQLTSAPAWAPTRSYPDGTYYWRVQVLDAASNVLSTSATRSFTRQTPMSTALSLGASTTLVHDTGTVTLNGRLTNKDTGAPLGSRNVYVLGRRATATSMTKLATVTTDSFGNVKFTHKPGRFWVYQFRYPSHGVVTGTKSARQLVKYQPVMKTAMVKTEIRKGTSTRLAGTISPYFKGRRIYLQKRTSTGGWKRINSKLLGSPTKTTPPVTKFAFPIAGTKTGYFYYRVSFPAKKNVNLGVVGSSTIIRVVP